jgi:homoserine dehydrogenase
LGFTIKLLAIGKEEDGSIEVRVHPVFIPGETQLAKVDGVYNAVQIEGDLVGRALFFGEGAGASATSSAVVADVISAAQDITFGVGSRISWKLEPGKRIKPMSEIEIRYYLRLNVVDRAGVLAKISQILGDQQISILSVIQKETDNATGTAELVIMTHHAREADMQLALDRLEHLDVVKEVGNFVRVED